MPPTTRRCQCDINDSAKNGLGLRRWLTPDWCSHLAKGERGATVLCSHSLRGAQRRFSFDLGSVNRFHPALDRTFPNAQPNTWEDAPAGDSAARIATLCDGGVVGGDR
jgi:hypothetical protein